MMPEHANLGWEHEAACRTEDPEMWFPVAAKERDNSPARQARQICQRCPVRVECAREAVNRGRSHGIWAGFRLDDRPDVDQRAALVAFVNTAPTLVAVV